MTPQPKPTRRPPVGGRMIRSFDGHRGPSNEDMDEGEWDIDTYDQEWMRNPSSDIGGS